jgi:hypothetical protein
VPAGEHEHHLRQERHGEQRGNPEHAQLGAVLRGLARAFRVASGGDHLVGVVARLAHGLDQRFHAGGGGLVTHAGLFGGEVDVRLDAFEAVEHFFDARRAGGAGHADELQLGAARRHGKAGFFDGGLEIRRRGAGRVILDAGLFRRQVDRGLDAGQAVEGFFQAGRAGGAGHACHGEFDALGSVHPGVSMWGVKK